MLSHEILSTIRGRRLRFKWTPGTSVSQQPCEGLPFSWQERRRGGSSLAKPRACGAYPEDMSDVSRCEDPCSVCDDAHFGIAYTFAGKGGGDNSCRWKYSRRKRLGRGITRVGGSGATRCTGDTMRGVFDFELRASLVVRAPRDRIV